MDWSFHHINVPSSNVRRDADFLSSLVGLKEGVWTYPDGAPDLHHERHGIAYFGVANFGLHVVRMVPTFAQENGFVHNPTVGGHAAINVPADVLSAYIKRSENAGVALTDASVYAMRGTHQTYVYDPSANMIEINATVEPFPQDRRHAQDAAAAVDLRAIVVPAHDLGASTQFYGDVIGLGAPREASETKAHFRSKTAAIHLATPTVTYPGRHNPTIAGAFVVGLDDLDGASAALSEADVPVSDLNDPVLGERVVWAMLPSARLIGLTAH